MWLSYTMGTCAELSDHRQGRPRLKAAALEDEEPRGFNRRLCRHSGYGAIAQGAGNPDQLEAGEIESAVTAFARSSNGGLIMPGSAAGRLHRDLIITLAAQSPPDVISTISVVAARGRNVSSPTISANHREFLLLFKPFRENDVCEFESSHPRHGVGGLASVCDPQLSAVLAARPHGFSRLARSRCTPRRLGPERPPNQPGQQADPPQAPTPQAGRATRSQLGH
jgi:hypothetical protein